MCDGTCGHMEFHVPLHPIEIHLSKLCNVHYRDSPLEWLCEATTIVVTTGIDQENIDLIHRVLLFFDITRHAFGQELDEENVAIVR
jgi:hypothetical protein